ncbi:RTA1 like protein-domain-containing protein [Dactylonectria macrodidyma]|uniref:RTA1 like protein-domain-containing protein n=1 Tax=Dactylonectria macrodidyma TaxID=307937 RepID=A0A9P9EFW3_9HYPO|nr:RTA1 like protein-domain-containing protein [Dactylonectria macrodidyma]
MANLSPTTLTPEGATSTLELVTPICMTAVPGEFGHVPPDACNAHYGFYPSWQWNLVFAVAFGITTLIHIVQAWRFKKTFCWVIIMGSLWETVCFIVRFLGARNQQELTYVIVSTLLFLLAPIWINAFAYMVIARLVHFLLPERKAILSARWIAKSFVAADVLSFAVQAVGGSMLADDDPEQKETGRRIYIGGIAIQLLFVLIFIVVAGKFVRRLRALMTDGKLEREETWVRPVIWTVFAGLFLIVVRIIFRLIEFGGGANGENELLKHEAYQLCLDALPMLLALVLLNAVHPAIVLKGPESEFPKRPWTWCGLRKHRLEEVYALTSRDQSGEGVGG